MSDKNETTYKFKANYHVFEIERMGLPGLCASDKPRKERGHLE